MRNRLCFLLLAGLILSSAHAQTAAPVVVRDPNAVALAARSLQAMAGITALKDITLQANANYIAGSDQEMGPATLIALGNQQSTVTLSLSGGQRQEIRNGVAGAWVGPAGTAHAIATHNCWTDANWFFPVFSLAALASDPTLVVSLAGQEVHEGQSVYHLSFLRNISGQTSDVIALVQQISAFDLYLDATSLLPVALDFNLHPDNDAGTNIPAEIRFGGYKAASGVQMPCRIQKYIQNTLVLDLTVTNMTVNSGVPSSAFTLPNVTEGGGQ